LQVSIYSLTIKNMKTLIRRERMDTPQSRLNSVLKLILCNIRYRQPDTNIDFNYLLKLYKRQGGKCPYQNIELAVIPRHQREALNLTWIPNSISIDRIDSRKGYFRGNVQFVSTLFNKVKQDLSNQSLFELAKTILKNRRRYNSIFKKIKEIR